MNRDARKSGSTSTEHSRLAAEFPELGRLSERARTYLAKNGFRRGTGATCTAEELTSKLRDLDAPVLETALRFEAIWGGGWGASLTLGPFAVLRQLVTEPDDRAWIRRLGERGLVLAAKFPRVDVAIDAEGALYSAPRDAPPERIADGIVTLLERYALVSATAARC
jgi:hypothetical protein